MYFTVNNGMEYKSALSCLHVFSFLLLKKFAMFHFFSILFYITPYFIFDQTRSCISYVMIRNKTYGPYLHLCGINICIIERWDEFQFLEFCIGSINHHTCTNTICSIGLVTKMTFGCVAVFIFSLLGLSIIILLSILLGCNCHCYCWTQSKQRQKWTLCAQLFCQWFCWLW